MYRFCLLLCIFTIMVLEISSSEYELWIPKSNRTDLRCPWAWCKDKYPQDDERCCVCNAKPYWQLSGSNINYLHIEYYRRSGASKVVGDNLVGSKIIHENGFLSKLPDNLCDYTNIVEINFRNNHIQSLSGISCLTGLDTLDVSYNQITSISNDTFIGMIHLRILTVTHNGLVSLDPSTITGTSFFIFSADFSHNNMTELDISNIIPDNNFCEYDFSYNQISDFINGGNFELDLEKIYEGGYVELIGNSFTDFFDFQDLGIDDIRTLGKVLNFGFSMPDAKWECNCIMQPYLELAEDIIKRIWRDYFNITCTGPDELKGQSIVDIVKQDRLDELTCNISESDKCPRHCSCVYQPSKNRTLIDCSNIGLEKMPNYLPEKPNIELSLKNNSIEDFSDSEYLENISNINFAENALISISNEVIKRFAKSKPDIELNLTINNIKTLPQEIQVFHPCRTIFGSIIVSCDCDSLWIKDWLHNKNADKCLNLTDIKCQTDTSLISALDLTRENVCDEQDIFFQILSSILAILCSVIIGIVGFIYKFRYEIYLLRRKLSLKKSNRVNCVMKYDVYTSFDDSNNCLRQWIVHKFNIQLKIRGYRTFVPCRDMLPGVPKEEEIADKINKSKNYIVMLCDKYISEDSFWTEIEWRYIWNSFQQNLSKKIIVINFGQLDSWTITCPKMKAFLRLSLELDFADRKHRLLNNVIKRLGSPNLGKNNHDKNTKTKFNGRHLKSAYIWTKEDYEHVKPIQDYKENLDDPRKGIINLEI